MRFVRDDDDDDAPPSVPKRGSGRREELNALGMRFAAMCLAVSAGRVDYGHFCRLLGGEEVYQQGKELLISMGVSAFNELADIERAEELGKLLKGKIEGDD